MPQIEEPTITLNMRHADPTDREVSVVWFQPRASTRTDIELYAGLRDSITWRCLDGSDMTATVTFIDSTGAHIAVTTDTCGTNATIDELENPYRYVVTLPVAVDNACCEFTVMLTSGEEGPKLILLPTRDPEPPSEPPV